MTCSCETKSDKIQEGRNRMDDEQGGEIVALPGRETKVTILVVGEEAVYLISQVLGRG